MKRRLVLYSGGQERRNALIHESLMGLSPSTGRLRMLYLPYHSDGAEVFYKRFQRRYRRFGATHFDCLPVDQLSLRNDPAAVRRVMSSDVIYLAGGNTFYFLKHLKRSGLAPVLKRFGARGGVLAGLSAGALILTPNIELAGYPPFDRDENDVGLTNLRALNLVRFEFFPHYRNSKKLNDALLHYSRHRRHPVYACRDGSGIVIEDDRFTAHGEVRLFHAGLSLKITS